MIGSAATAGGLMLFVAMALVSALGFLVHVVVSRDLSRADYGALASLLALILVLSVPASALQAAITQKVALVRSAEYLEQSGAGPVSFRPLLATAVIYGVLGFGVLLAMAPLVMSFLHLDSVTPAILLATWAVPAAIGLVPRAVLLGAVRYRRVAAGVLAGAIVRLVLTAILASRSGVSGAIAAIVFGEVVTSLILLWALRDFVAEHEDGAPLGILRSEAARPIVALTGYWMLTSVDTLVARRVLDAASSGIYSASAVAARAAMFLPGAIALVVFPRFSEAGGEGTRARSVLFRALGTTSAISLAMVAAVLLMGREIVAVLFGASYEASIGPLRLLVFGSACLGVVNVLMYFFLAMRRGVLAATPWLACIAIAGLATLQRPNITGLALTTSGSSLVLLLFMMVAVVVRRAPSEASPSDLATRDVWTMPEAELDVTVVVPYFNPGPAVARHITMLTEVLDRCDASYEIIAVSDGSTDGSDAAVGALRHPFVESVTLEQNQGKGSALRVGLARGRGRYIGFIDADGDIDCAALQNFIRLIELYDPDIVLGSKRHPMSSVSYPPIRRLYSWSFQQLTRILFRLNIRDSQTGLKLIRRDVLAAVLPRMVEKRFAFDLELFVVARHLGFKKFFEAPVTIHHQFNSTISTRAVRGMILDTLAILYRLRGLRFYDRAGSTGGKGPEQRSQQLREISGS